MYLLHRLKKVAVEDKKIEKADPMLDMMERIRSGNVQLKKVQGNPAPKPQKEGTGDVMSEMAKLLVSNALRMTLMMVDWCVCVCVYIEM